MKLTEHFTREEFDCKDGTIVPEDLMTNVTELATNLEVIRSKIGEPLRVLSGYRTKTHNKKIGGKNQSKHILGQAADLTCKNHTPNELHRIILDLIKDKKIKQGGVGLYKGFVHFDIRSKKARW